MEERRINTDPEKKRGEQREKCTLEGHPQIIMDRFTSVLRRGVVEGGCHSNGAAGVVWCGSIRRPGSCKRWRFPARPLYLMPIAREIYTRISLHYYVRYLFLFTGNRSPVSSLCLLFDGLSV